MKMKKVKNIKRWFAILLALLSLVGVIPFTVFSESAEKTSADVSTVLDATLAKLADNVKAPAFGTNAGEWTVLCLARGGYYAGCDKYFSDYYGRIVEYVNTKAEKIGKNGALHKSKSTDNSRLILALSAIGRDATSVGEWDLTAPYSDFEWIKKQGINGVIFTLIALDTMGYDVEDGNVRQQCIDYLFDKQLADGGWALSGTSFNADITGMALQALAPYREDAEVAEAAALAFDCLSKNQCESGGFKYGSGETSESVAQVIVACATWGIDPHTDSRFIKNGNSAIDALLEYYDEDEAMFKHFIMAESNNMATDQACYALIAYDRFLKGKTALYDCGDVMPIDPSKPLHDYSVAVTAPTCTEGGYTTHTCLLCGDSYVDGEVEKLGHVAGDWVTVKAPEIGVEGEKTKSCTVCGTVMETAVIEALSNDTEGNNGDADVNTDTENGSVMGYVFCAIGAVLLLVCGAVIIRKRKSKN